MAPKKDEKKTEVAKSGPFFTEVERTFLIQELAEANRKVGRLRLAVDEYEVRNEELQNSYDKLDEDRADIISYLKKTLTIKNEENIELKDRVKELEEVREIETAQFRERVQELERNFTTMKDQLTSENKLFAGKLNTLEEFRAIRDDLMKKYEKQEQAFRDQDMKYKRIIYEAEKKFIIGKDKLKKEMEARLLQLAQDFQDATELRIAASTHRVIRENIAINNELDSILSTQAKLSEQNEKYKESERDAKVAMELAEEERDKAINKNIVQLKVIDQLTNAFQEVKKERAIYQKNTFDLERFQVKIKKLSNENERLHLQVKILEQNLHARLTDQNKTVVETSKMTKEANQLKCILKDAALAIQAALKLDEWATVDPQREIMNRRGLLHKLLYILSQYHDIHRVESIETIASFGNIYEKGDLGFIPKVAAKKKSVTALGSHTSKDLEQERLSAAPSVATSSHASLKTIPSTNIIPLSSEPELVPKDSLESFATSLHSSLSSEASEEESEHAEIMSKLEASKLEIQKSIMKDLMYTQSYQSKLRLSHDVGLTSKSLIKMEPDENDAEKSTKSMVRIRSSVVVHDEQKEGETEDKADKEDKEHVEAEEKDKDPEKADDNGEDKHVHIEE